MADNLPADFRLPKIMCFVCKTAVERVVVNICRHRMATTIKVWCHGSTDEMELTERFVCELGNDSILNQTGIAFAPKSDHLIAPPLRELPNG